MIGVRHPTRDETIRIDLLQLKQTCRCGEQMQGKWAFSRLGGSWQCLDHLEPTLAAELITTPSPVLRTKHSVLFGSVHMNPMHAIHEACAEAEQLGMVLLSLVPAPDGSLVATFVGPETIIRGTE